MTTPLCMFALLLTTLIAGGSAALDEGAVVKGKVEFDENRLRSWDDQPLEIPVSEIETRLRERVQLPPIPFPEGWDKMDPEKRKAWIKEFENSDAGKKLIAERESIFNGAKSFDVKIENNGDFVVYDVPPGVYGLQGRVDKELNGCNYSYEIFGQIEILQEVDEVVLDPIQIAVTPLLKTNQPAPPLEVKIQKDDKLLTLEGFKGKYVFVHFWISNNPSTVFLENVQKMHAELQDKHDLKLFNISVDDDRAAAIKFVIQKSLSGNHGFTEGFYHRSLFDYGIRSIPSIWLIGPDGKILMTQYDFATAFRSGMQDLTTIVSDRITGKYDPTALTDEKVPAPGSTK